MIKISNSLVLVMKKPEEEQGNRKRDGGLIFIYYFAQVNRSELVSVTVVN